MPFSFALMRVITSPSWSVLLSNHWARVRCFRILGIIGLWSCIASAQASEAITIRFSHAVATKTPKGMMAQRFKQLAEERLPGQVKVKIYPRSLMYQDSNVSAAIAAGKVELAAPALAKLKSFTPKLQVFDLPFLFPDMNAVDRFQSSADGQALLSSMAAHNIIGLGYLHNGMKQLSANVPVVHPRDIVGKTYRIMNSQVLQAQFQAVGAEPVIKPFTEVYNLLLTGQVDGQENTWSNIYTSHFYRAQRHITESNHGVLDYMVITSETFWQGLPDHIRATLERCLQEAIAYGNQVAARKNQQNRTAILGSGMTQVSTLSDAQRALWVAQMRPVWKQFEQEVGEDLIKSALQAGKAR